MKYYEDFGEGLILFKYNEKKELAKLIKKLREKGCKMSVKDYVDFMHEGSENEDITMEVMLILCRLLNKYADELYIDQYGMIRLRIF